MSEPDFVSRRDFLKLVSLIPLTSRVRHIEKLQTNDFSKIFSNADIEELRKKNAITLTYEDPFSFAARVDLSNANSNNDELFTKIQAVSGIQKADFSDSSLAWITEQENLTDSGPFDRSPALRETALLTTPKGSFAIFVFDTGAIECTNIKNIFQYLSDDESVTPFKGGAFLRKSTNAMEVAVINNPNNIKIQQNPVYNPATRTLADYKKGQENYSESDIVETSDQRLILVRGLNKPTKEVIPLGESNLPTFSSDKIIWMPRSDTNIFSIGSLIYFFSYKSNVPDSGQHVNLTFKDKSKQVELELGIKSTSLATINKSGAYFEAQTDSAITGFKNRKVGTTTPLSVITYNLPGINDGMATFSQYELVKVKLNSLNNSLVLEENSNSVWLVNHTPFHEVPSRKANTIIG